MVHPLCGGAHYSWCTEKIDPKFPKLSPEEQKQLERFRDMIKKETDKPLEEIRKEMEKEEK